MGAERYVLATVWLLLVAMPLSLSGCSADAAGRDVTRDGTGAELGSGGANSGGAISSGGDDGSSSGGDDGNASGDATGAGGHSAIGRETECNGVDDDGNGLIDDVDEGRDGICDCLKIATLGSSTYLTQSNVIRDWLNTRSTSGFTDLGSAQLTSATLSEFQVIVVQNLLDLGRDYEPSELDAIEAWVRNGGGLLTITGYAGYDVNANAILNRFGMSYQTGLVLLALVFDPQGVAGLGTLPITQWTHPHPVTEGVTQVGINNGYPVAGDGVVLASEGGHDLMLANEVDDGRVIAFADEWITFDGQWSMHPEYQVERLWLNMIKWLTPPTECQVPITLE